jgi:hypothetical protein
VSEKQTDTDAEELKRILQELRDAYDKASSVLKKSHDKLAEVAENVRT